MGSLSPSGSPRDATDRFPFPMSVPVPVPSPGGAGYTKIPAQVEQMGLKGTTMRQVEKSRRLPPATAARGPVALHRPRSAPPGGGNGGLLGALGGKFPGVMAPGLT